MFRLELLERTETCFTMNAFNDEEYDRLGLTRRGTSYDLSKNIDLYAAATYVRCGKDLKDHEEGDDG